MQANPGKLPPETMPLQFFNTLTRRLEEFVPLTPGRVGMYVCGPTVYAAPHIGNLRTFFFADILHRYLEYRNYSVRFVMNLTDVDDKTINGARRDGVSLAEYTEPFAEMFFRDLDTLGIRRADSYPRATAHIAGMIALIERLLEKNLAYVAEGSVYFRIAAFPGYSKLSRVDLDAARQGERVADDEYEKDDVRDFALWKAAKPEDEAVGAAWDTPWGRGRPGWHIECSTMARRPDQPLDIHGGGTDLIFPHHESELAQAEAVSGDRPFVRHWVHTGQVFLSGEKMSKSLGNLVFVRDLLDRHDPLVVRRFLLRRRYREDWDFDERRLDDEGALKAPSPTDRPWSGEAERAAFFGALDEDMNTPAALAILDRAATSSDPGAREFVEEAEEILGLRPRVR